MYWNVGVMRVAGLASALAFAASMTVAPHVEAQDPAASPTAPIQVTLTDVAGAQVGTATLTQGADNVVTVSVTVQGLEPGDHGIHIHARGECNPAGERPFGSAGPHFNPTDVAHGGPPVAGEQPAASPAPTVGHAGDLGNITVGEDGTGTLEIRSGRFTLGQGEASLVDQSGSSLVIHANPDDLVTDPAGKSGGRIACGVISPNTVPPATPGAETPAP